jgi:hypothetical protein
VVDVRNTPVRGPGLWLAVDPGGCTGWLLFRPVVDPEQLAGVGIVPVAWGEESDQMAFCDRVFRYKTARLPSERITGIVIEGWWPREGVRTWQPEAVEIIGACRWLMGNDPSRFFVQKPSDREWATPAKINRYRHQNLPPYNVGKGGQGHAVQALKHALLWTSTRWSPE